MPEPKNALESHLHYTVGWIAPLPIERAAAKAMFDEEHDTPIDFEQPKADPNSYSWGEIGGHNIVLASLKAGLYGTTSAASSATMMLRSFPEIRFGLLVGIGGAIPRSNRDIRLGDIVVAQPSGSSGGVIQYDLLKAKAGGVQERKYFLNSPPEVLLYALGNLQAQHEEEPSKVVEFLQEMENRKPYMFKPRSGNPGYRYPGPSKDRLFRSTYDHQGGSDCSGCAGEEEEKREPREDTSPVIHYGVIVSRNALVKDASAREELLQHIPDDCLCYEMEAAGLMNNFPCLVIRGISDYSDSHKNDHWQRYASTTAAAFAKELLVYVSADRVRREEKALVVIEKLSKIEADVSDTKQAAVSLRNRRDIDDIIAWLSPVNVQVSHSTAWSKRMQGSCTWFLQGEAFRSWKRCPSSFLWLNGIVGCGKTVLSSAIIENLKAEEKGSDCVVLYFYFGSDSTRDCLDGMVRALLSQIITATSEIPENLWHRYQTCKQSTHAGTKSLLDDFHLIVSSLDEVKIVLDALDEVKSESRESILTWIKESFPIQKTPGSRISLIALSRHESIFQHNFEGICREVQISRNDVDLDIQRYIQERLKTIQESQGWELSSREVQQIEATLLKKANGMFRLAAVQIDSLRDCDTLDGLQQDLQLLPTTLTKMYDNIIEHMSPTRKKRAIRLLQLLAYAERQLRLDEVAAAILMDFSENPSIVPSNKFLQKNNLPDYCPSLVLLEKVSYLEDWQYVYRLRHDKKGQLEPALLRDDDQDAESRRYWFPNRAFVEPTESFMIQPSSYTVVRLAHFSVTEYLRSGTHEKFKEQQVHSIILQLSLGYLKSLSTISPDVPPSAVRRNYPFSDYASRFWPQHANSCEKDQKAQDSIVHFLTDLQAFRTWIFVLDPKGGYRYVRRSNAAEMRLSDSSVDIPTPLQIATTFGLGEVVKALLDSSVPLSEQYTFSDSDKYDNRWLQAFYTKSCSWSSMIKSDPIGPILRTCPLYIACCHGWEDIAVLLLEKGLRLHDHTGSEGSAFTAACRHHHKNLVHRLVDIEACQEMDGSERNSEVTLLFIYGYWTPLKVLLDVGVGFPPCTTDYRFYADWKLFENRFRLIDFILEMTSWTNSPTGFDVVTRVRDASPGLASAMKLAIPFIMGSSEPQLIDIIIRSDGALLGSELHEAVWSGDITFLKAVLPRWKDLFKSYDQRGQSPLHLAAEMGRVDIIEVLISAGFSLDVTDKWANRPLSWALLNNHIHVLGLLSPYQGSIERERTRLKKQLEIIAAVDMEDFPRLMDIYGASAHVSFIKENPLAKSAFCHAIMKNSTAVSNFLLSNEPNIYSWNRMQVETYACAIEAGNFDFMTIFPPDGNADFAFFHFYNHTPYVFAINNGSLGVAEWLVNQVRSRKK